MMAEYITSVLEIQEAGLSLRADGEHVVRVLGALPVAMLPAASGAKEAIAETDRTAFTKYFAGELQPPPPDAGAADDPFQVPDVLVTASGEIGFLKRGGVA
jgi:hypothetical protein